MTGDTRQPFFEHVLARMFNTTWELISPENIAQAAGAVAACVSLAISLTHIFRHWRYNRSTIRKSTVRLLFVVPIFALDCWACLMLEASEYDWAELLTGVREVYEAVALVSFMELVLTILGGTKHLAEQLERKAQQEPEDAWHPWPLRVLMRRHETMGPILGLVLRGIFQYVFACLVYLLLVGVVWGLDRLELLGPEALRVAKSAPNLLKAVSCGYALSCLLIFAHLVKELVPSCGLAWKFLSIKGIVFFTFWQGFVIGVAQRTGQFDTCLHWVNRRAVKTGMDSVEWDDSELKSGLNDLLLCFEVLFFSVLHLFAYPAREMESMPEEVQARLRLESAKGEEIERIFSAVNLTNIAVLQGEISQLSGGNCRAANSIANSPSDRLLM